MFVTLAETLIDPALVLVAFIGRLTDSPGLIGRATPLRDGGWFLPQFWLSGYVQNLPRKLGLCRWTAAVRIAARGAMTLAVFVVHEPGLSWLAAAWLLAAYALSGVQEAGAGVAGQPLLPEMAPAAARSLYLGFTTQAAPEAEASA